MTSQCHGHGVFTGEDDVVPVFGVVRLRVAVLSAPGIQVRTTGEKTGSIEISERTLHNNYSNEVSSSNKVSYKFSIEKSMFHLLVVTLLS